MIELTTDGKYLYINGSRVRFYSWVENKIILLIKFKNKCIVSPSKKEGFECMKLIDEYGSTGSTRSYDLVHNGFSEGSIDLCRSGLLSVFGFLPKEIWFKIV